MGAADTLGVSGGAIVRWKFWDKSGSLKLSDGMKGALAAQFRLTSWLKSVKRRGDTE